MRLRPIGAILTLLLLGLAACGPTTYPENDPELTKQVEVVQIAVPSLQRYPYPFALLAEVEVDENGVLRDLKIYGSDQREHYEGFEEAWGGFYNVAAIRDAAETAVRSATFEAARIGSQAVRQRRVIPVRFNADAVAITPPKVARIGPVSQPPPDMPLDMLNGDVVLEILIDRSGRVVEATPLFGAKVWCEIASRDMKGCAFDPGLLDGEPIPVRMCFRREYRIEFVN